MATREDKDQFSYTQLDSSTFAKNVLLKNDLIGDATWDYAAQVQASTTDTWTFRDGGVSGTITAVIVITYVDSTKAVILNVERTT